MFGLSIADAMNDIYTQELRFELKKSQKSVLVKPVSGSLIAEALFGCYPRGEAFNYFQENYRYVFEPEELVASPESWKKAFKAGALTPMRFTRYKTEPEIGWRDSLTIFVFDPASPLDCIDLWNMRSESISMFAVPINWWNDLLPEIRAILRAEHRPMRGNSHGVMHRGTIEFGRSIPEERAKALAEAAGNELVDGSVLFKGWRTPVWRPAENGRRTASEGPVRIKVAEKRVTLEINEQHLTANVECLSPDFAEQYGGHDLRWVNTIQPSQFHEDRLGTTLPFNSFDPYSAMLQSFGEPVLIGREGWSIGQRYKDMSSRLKIPEAENAVASALKHYGIDAKLSEPGHIAKQILGHIDGLWGVRMLADPETLEMLNIMAGGIRRKGVGNEETEELFDRRSKSIRDWQALVQRRKKKGFGVESLQDFTTRNIIRLGIKSKCPNCALTNWHNLSVVDYNVVCERCQKDYPFPQANLEKNNDNWAFRVVGPFAVPDYARGSYGALLALNALNKITVSQDRLSFSTAVSLSFDGMEAEADFVALHAPERHGTLADPELIICEAKSFGSGPLITAKDLTKLRLIAQKIEGAVIVISVLRNHFVAEELKLLKPFVRWCRRPGGNGEMRNPVILLTGHEAFSQIDIGHTWKELGGVHAQFEGCNHRDSLSAFAEATQSIHLGLPGYHSELYEKLKTKRKNR